MTTPFDPNEFSWRMLVVVGGFAALGGLAAFIDRLRKHDLHTHFALEFMADLAYALAAGYAAYFLVLRTLSEHQTAVVGAIIAGHLGARWLTLLERWLVRRFAPQLKVPDDD